MHSSSQFLKISNKLAKKFIVKTFSWSFENEQKVFENYKKIYKFVKCNSQVNKKIFSCPIFILGLPRSGTSLIEKILSHSLIKLKLKVNLVSLLMRSTEFFLILHMKTLKILNIQN